MHYERVLKDCMESAEAKWLDEIPAVAEVKIGKTWDETLMLFIFHWRAPKTGAGKVKGAKPRQGLKEVRKFIRLKRTGSSTSNSEG